MIIRFVLLFFICFTSLALSTNPPILLNPLPEIGFTECPTPTHPRMGDPWVANDEGWMIVDENNASNSLLAEIPPDAEVKRIFTKYFYSNLIDCIFTLPIPYSLETQKLEMEKTFYQFCVQDQTADEYLAGFFSSTGTCTTKASTPYNCRITHCLVIV